MSVNPCSAFGYTCNTPTPRSAFAEDGPLCAAVGQFLYDPANCDPGYWCGCSSILESECLPTNSYNTTKWMGRFTTTNNDGTTIVLEGLKPFINENTVSGSIDLKCPDGLYCPGFSDADRCVDLCPPKKVCEDPSEAKECPKESFCPIATTVALECEGLQSCESEGLRRAQSTLGMGIIFAVLIVAVAHLFLARCIITKRDRETKAAKAEQAVKTKQIAYEDEEVDVDADTRTTHKVAPPDMTIDIDFEGLSLTIPNVGTIMHGVSGSLKHGEVTCIMGPSGSGKTTFLNLMAGKVDRTEGSVKINGEEGELPSYRKVIGFVPQEDVMLRNLTVEDNVRHSALMRLPVEWSREEKLLHVDETLDSLEISHVRDSIVGDENRRGVSGGQRKRVNIALEMVMRPSLLCLDEPTSGLDSTTSLTVVQSLKDMANSGVNVIAVLHQPKYEIFNLFDKVLLLGKGGFVAYHGERSGLEEYFEKQGFPLPPMTNPADFYMDVLSGIVPHQSNANFTKEDLIEAWLCAPENPNAVSVEEAASIMEKTRLQDEGEQTQKKKNFIIRLIDSIGTNLHDVFVHLCSDMRAGQSNRKTPGTFAQFCLLFKRTYFQRVRNPWGSFLTVILMMLAGSLIANLVPQDSILYSGIPKSLLAQENEVPDPFWEGYLRQNINPVDQVPSILSSVYFFLLIVSCLSVNIFGQERPVFFRDTAAGQKVVAYWAAKTLEILLWIPIYGAAFVLLGYTSEAWFLQSLKKYWVFFFLDIAGFYGIGMVASLILGGGSSALLALVFGIMVIIFFGGTIGEAPSLSKIFFVFWSTQGLSTNEYDIYRSYGFDVDLLNANSDDDGVDELGVGQSTVGAGVGSNFDLSAGFGKNAGLCAATALAWHLIALWTLKTRNHKKQR